MNPSWAEGPRIQARFFRRYGVEKSLKPSSGWDRLVRDAGAAGIRGEDCDVLYRDCDAPVTRKMRKAPRDEVSAGAKDRATSKPIR